MGCVLWGPAAPQSRQVGCRHLFLFHIHAHVTSLVMVTPQNQLCKAVVFVERNVGYLLLQLGMTLSW